MTRRWLLLFLCFFAVTGEARAQDTMDSQLWMQTLAIGQLGPRWRTHLELQPRMFDNMSELGLTLVRTAIGRQLTPRVSVWVGHAWVPRTLGPTTTHENRLWQQVSITLPRAGQWLRPRASGSSSAASDSGGTRSTGCACWRAASASSTPGRRGTWPSTTRRW